MLNHQIRCIYYLQCQKIIVTSSFVSVHQTSSRLLISVLLQCWLGADKESLYISLSLVGLKANFHNNQRKPKAKSICSMFSACGGTVASWLVCLIPKRAIWVKALAEDTVLCSWARHFIVTVTVPCSTQVYN